MGDTARPGSQSSFVSYTFHHMVLKSRFGASRGVFQSHALSYRTCGYTILRLGPVTRIAVLGEKAYLEILELGLLSLFSPGPSPLHTCALWSRRQRDHSLHIKKCVVGLVSQPP